MKHDENLDRMLLDYADGTLSTESRQALDAHLQTCGTCRTHLDGYHRDGELLARAAAHSLPGSPLALPFSELAARSRTRSRRSIAGLATAACCTLLFGFAILRSDSPTLVEAPAISSEQVAALELRIRALEEDLQRMRAANAVRAEARAVESQSRREEMAAMGLAAAQQYDARGDQTRAVERYQYIATQYADTRAAARAKARLTELASPAV